MRWAGNSLQSRQAAADQQRETVDEGATKKVSCLAITCVERAFRLLDCCKKSLKNKHC